jgi:multidrug efflux pump
VMISLVVSLTTTPMMCAWLLREPAPKPSPRPSPAGGRGSPGRLARWAEAGFARVLKWYEASLDWALASLWLVLFILVCVIGLNVYLFSAAPKGFFPQQDTGQLQGGLRADQSISSQAMGEKLRQVVGIIHRDPAVATVVGFTGGGRAGGGFMFVNLKPAGERSESGQAVIARLRPQLAQVTGLQVFLSTVQDVRAGGRQSSSTYQYTLKSDNLPALRLWATQLAEEMKLQSDVMTDVDTDQQDNGVETLVEIDRDSAARLGLSAATIDSALYNAFGQRPVATIYGELNQYRVIMEWHPRYAQGPNALADVYVPARGLGTGTSNTQTVATAAAAAAAASGTPSTVPANPGSRDSSTGNALSNTVTPLVPLTAVARFVERATPTAISHQDGELATTISFNLAEGRTLADAGAAIRRAEADIGMPTAVRGSF